MADDDVRRLIMEARIASRKAVRRETAKVIVAGMILSGHPVQVVSTSEAEAKQLYDDAVDFLKGIAGA